ncbi:hypothetical protein KDK95_29335, partial [Actinospica sp. MGRD01-02]
GVGRWLLEAPDGTVRIEAEFASRSMRVRAAAPAGGEIAIALAESATAGQIAAAVLAMLPAEPDGPAPGGAAGR